MKRNVLLLFVAVLSTARVYAQGVGINATGAAADTSAMLDVSSTNRGLLIPRLTWAQRSGIVLPATGLMIYQTDSLPGFYFYTGTSWQSLGNSAISGTVVRLSERTGLTPEGGFAVRMTNKTGSSSTRGQIVQPGHDPSTYVGAFEVAPANSWSAVGVVYENGIPDGSQCWVVVSGIADVLFDDASPFLRSGRSVYVSDLQPGRARSVRTTDGAERAIGVSVDDRTLFAPPFLGKVMLQLPTLNTPQDVLIGSVVHVSSTDTLYNKTLFQPAFTGGLTLTDAATSVADEVDRTKKLQFQLSGLSTATTRTIAVPNANTTLVGTDATQTLTNKTLDNAVLTGNVTLPISTSSAVGVLLKGASRFVHDYQAPGTNGQNTFIGMNAGSFSLSGSGVSASFNTATGYGSLQSLADGYSNSAFGYLSLALNTSGANNSAFGMDALYANVAGSHNSGFGRGALQNNTASYNSALGAQSLFQNTTGAYNSAFGYQSMYVNTTASSNSAFGAWSLHSNTASGNSAFGDSSLTANTTGNKNAAFGYRSLTGNVVGWGNSAFGNLSLMSNSNGYENSAFGDGSLVYVVSGSLNSAFGANALGSNINGSYNSAVGVNSLINAKADYNSALGYSAGTSLTTGTNNTFIGNNAQPSSAIVSDEITLGNANITKLRCQVTSITALSDARDKRNIRDLPLGLEFLMNVKPRLFNWDRREWYTNRTSDGSKMQATPTAGFIAQELDEVQTKEHTEWLDLVLKSNPNRLEATPGNLLPIIVNAIQELKRENDVLRGEILALRASNERLSLMEQKIRKLEQMIASSAEGGQESSTTKPKHGDNGLR